MECVSEPHSFLWPNNIPLSGETTSPFVHSSTDGPFGCFLLSAVVTGAAASICERVFV